MTNNLKSNKKYWVYETAILHHKGHTVQAKLLSSLPEINYNSLTCEGYVNPRQDWPYGIDLDLTYQIKTNDPCPDAYYESFGFTLYSNKLINLLDTFGVKYESFPITMVNENGEKLSQLKYSVFHTLEGILKAMDEEKSDWTGDRYMGIPRLILDYGAFDNRPIFKCESVFTQLIRNDVKEEIHSQGITGLQFLAPEKYSTGEYALFPVFND